MQIIERALPRACSVGTWRLHLKFDLILSPLSMVSSLAAIASDVHPVLR